MHQERHPAVVLEVDGVDAALGRLHVDVLPHSIDVVLGRLGDGVEDGMPSRRRNQSRNKIYYLLWRNRQKPKSEVCILCELKPWLLILLLVLVLVAGDEVDGLFISVIGLKTHGADS